tara:strand:+ start:80 stop:535 length:456 start_codon:yes stop_codon:yes gene_type:complete
MLKKTLTILLICVFVKSCGYSPMYSKKNDINFNFKKINIKGDNDLKNLIKSYLKRYNNENNENEIYLDINVVYDKISQTKNISGETTDYLLVAKVEFKTTIDNNEQIIIIKEDFVMKNIEREFDEKKYERTIKQNLAFSIVNKFILKITRK